MNEEELSIYEGWEKSKLDQINKELFQYEKGKEEGIEEGAWREKKKMLRNFLSQNTEKEMILKIMQLTQEKYDRLIK